jgi:hypothetical protein
MMNYQWRKDTVPMGTRRLLIAGNKKRDKKMKNIKKTRRWE